MLSETEVNIVIKQQVEELLINATVWEKLKFAALFLLACTPYGKQVIREALNNEP